MFKCQVFIKRYSIQNVVFDKCYQNGGLLRVSPMARAKEQMHTQIHVLHLVTFQEDDILTFFPEIPQKSDLLVAFPYESALRLVHENLQRKKSSFEFSTFTIFGKSFMLLFTQTFVLNLLFHYTVLILFVHNQAIYVLYLDNPVYCILVFLYTVLQAILCTEFRHFLLSLDIPLYCIKAIFFVYSGNLLYCIQAILLNVYM